jgi:menaquinone-dependent protoporphyrinogen oxidase
MKTLIAYGTTEGQTRKIADFVAIRLRKLGDQVTLVEAVEAPWDLRPNEYDAAILAASLHAGIYQKPLIEFARTHHLSLCQMPAHFLSVSLSATSRDPDDLTSTAACAERFKQETGWTSAVVHHVAGAFRFTEYDFFKRWVMRLIAWEKGVSIGSSQELELTDWNALAEIADKFHVSATAAQKSPSACDHATSTAKID